MAEHVLPPRRLRINRREVKQVYNKYKPNKRDVPPPAPFDPEDHFLDFVDLLDPLAPAPFEQEDQFLDGVDLLSPLAVQLVSGGP
jgi:hypothetical protein